MTRLLIICHGPTDAVRAARFPADEDVAERDGIPAPPSRPMEVGRWLSGPERRAMSTAAALGGDRVVAVEVELRDWDCGRWAGRSLDELGRHEPAGLAAWLSDPAAAPHGGESLLDLLGRVGRWLDRQAADETKAAAVTHPAVLRAAVAVALGAGPAAFWRIDAPPLCRARLSHDDRRWVLQRLGPG